MQIIHQIFWRTHVADGLLLPLQIAKQLRVPFLKTLPTRTQNERKKSPSLAGFRIIS